jgi:hypothetical protein
LKKELVEDSSAGFLINDTLSITLAMRVLTEAEYLEYQKEQQQQVSHLPC